jgi:hypothetical protein
MKNMGYSIFGLCWKATGALVTFIWIGLYLYYLMAWRAEYVTLVERMRLKRESYTIWCSNREELKNDRAMQRECEEMELAMAKISDPLMVSFANTGEALRLCGNQDCFELFSNITERFVGATMNFVWFFMMASIGLGVVVILLMWTLWFLFGRNAFYSKKYKKSLPMLRQVKSIEEYNSKND